MSAPWFRWKVCGVLGSVGWTIAEWIKLQLATPETTDIGGNCAYVRSSGQPQRPFFWDRGNHAEMVVCAGGGNAARRWETRCWSMNLSNNWTPRRFSLAT